MRYISDLKDGSSVKDIYLCKKRQSLVTRAGKAYETLTFQDKTGTIDAKIWDPDSMGIGEFGEMDYGSFRLSACFRTECRRHVQDDPEICGFH